jgi:hypothetical protein
MGLFFVSKRRYLAACENADCWKARYDEKCDELKEMQENLDGVDRRFDDALALLVREECKCRELADAILSARESFDRAEAAPVAHTWTTA